MKAGWKTGGKIIKEILAIPTSDKPRPIYATEETKVGFEAADSAAHLAATLPPEDMQSGSHPITFTPEDELRGLSAIYAAGTVVFTGHDVVVVPERTLKILRKLGIPYQAGSLVPEDIKEITPEEQHSF